MHNKRIIYPNNEGGIAIIIPAPDCGIALEQIAAKDVPAGVPFRIVDAADVLEDRTFRNAWEADFTNPDGHGKDYGSGSLNEVVAWTEDGRAVIQCRDEEGCAMGLPVMETPT